MKQGKMSIQGTSTTMSLPDLPPDAIMEILYRLPVKSLSKFKCVSKSWRSLISSSQFIKEHLHVSITSSRQKILTAGFSVPVKVWPVYQQDNGFVMIDLCGLHEQVLVHGSCGGLVCLSIQRDIRKLGTIVILNPNTKKSRRITHWGIESQSRRYFTSYGFGYDSSADDYKVVGILCRDGDDQFSEKEAVVYELKKKGFWRRIQDFPSSVALSDDSAKLVKGSLHWGVTRRGSESSWVIVSLDLEKETYSEVPQPVYGDQSGFKSSVGVVGGGCLGILCDYSGSHVDVWVMKEYGVRESWTKIFSIPNSFSTEYLKPLLCLKNGQVLVEYSEERATLVYDPEENKFKNPIIHYVTGCIEYDESLVSPNAEEDDFSQNQ